VPRTTGRLEIGVFSTPRELPPRERQARAGAIVIDVLRATTTLAYAFRAGALAARFYGTPAAARRGARRAGGKVLLCGEREGRAIPGFDLGNSPLEYTPARVAGATLLFTSTNGSLAFLASRFAAVQWAVGFVNAQAAVEAVAGWAAGARENGEAAGLLVVCAGKEGEPAPEDSLCAAHVVGHLVRRLAAAGIAARVQGEGLHPPAGPEAAAAAVRQSPHARYLRSLGPEFARDVEASLAWDVLEVVPSGRGARLCRTSLRAR
jgi:2-phosphosulfolactate phosphatase